MYYLLTFKLSRAAEKLPGYANLDTEELEQKVAENTYLLALDGDVDFEPQSVITLVHKMQIDPDTAAVCGRIHPKGFGETYKPLSWFFETVYWPTLDSRKQSETESESCSMNTLA